MPPTRPKFFDESLIQSEPWHPARLILFRFAVFYIAMFSLSHFFVAPAGEHIQDVWELPWDRFVPWVGETVFGIEEMTARPLGSGDTTYNYVQLFAFLIVSGLGALVWTLFDRRRQYPVFSYACGVYLSYYLGLVMFTYGIVKVIKTQFPSPMLSILLQPIGEASPMRLLWTFMGFSGSYTFFAGLGEVVGGVLLFFKRTRTLGALIVIGVMSNVAMMNFSYDVPVKIFSVHLLVFAFILLIPDARRLLNVFFLNQPASPANLVSPVSKGWPSYTSQALKVAIVGFAMVTSTLQALEFRGMIQEWRATPLRGIYEVDQFSINGEPLAPVLTDSTRWKRMIVDFPNFVTIHGMDDTNQFYNFEPDTTAKTIAFYTPQDTLNKSLLTYSIPEEGRFHLEGVLNQDTLSILFDRKDEADFLLTNRGFHWINEVPFNR